MKNKRIFLTAKDIQILTGTTLANCYKQMRHLKDVLDKRKCQKITFKDYADYKGVTMEEIYQALPD